MHSYFFHDSYVPHFVPPSSPTETDAVIISRDLIEESVLSDLQWYFCLTETGEYVLDAGLTYVSELHIPFTSRKLIVGRATLNA